VGLETGNRTLDKLDIILLLIVLLLRVSLLVIGLISFSMKLFLCIYNYLSAQGLVAGVHNKVLPMLQFLLYISMHLGIFTIVCLQ
jgi:hypothetical protein